jgi:hypothetical protein
MNKKTDLQPHFNKGDAVASELQHKFGSLKNHLRKQGVVFNNRANASKLASTPTSTLASTPTTLPVSNSLNTLLAAKGKLKQQPSVPIAAEKSLQLEAQSVRNLINILLEESKAKVQNAKYSTESEQVNDIRAQLREIHHNLGNTIASLIKPVNPSVLNTTRSDIEEASQQIENYKKQLTALYGQLGGQRRKHHTKKRATRSKYSKRYTQKN